jgi:enterochelin esterase-like enzyme
MTPRSFHFRPLTILLFLIAGNSFGGTITHHSFTAATLSRDYPYNIYLPDGYADGDLFYPVLYLLHGSNGNENDWPVSGHLQETADRLIAKGAIPPAIIVMPGSKSWWVDGYNEKAKTAFFSDLIPHVQRTYRTVERREGRLIAGLSAGGYGSINFILEFPEMFAAAAALSPAIYTPYPPQTSSARQHAAYIAADGSFDPETWERLNYTRYIDAYKSQDIIVPLYINSGDHDTYDIAYHAAVLYQSLREHQPDFVEFRVVDGDHDWNVWAETLPAALTYIFRFSSRPKTRN